MSNREPYIGMPIILGDYDEKKVSNEPMVMNMHASSIGSMPVAMAFVSWQQWQKPYELEKAFRVGTIFPDLNLPFLGYQGGQNR